MLHHLKYRNQQKCLANMNKGEYSRASFCSDYSSRKELETMSIKESILEKDSFLKTVYIQGGIAAISFFFCLCAIFPNSLNLEQKFCPCYRGQLANRREPRRS